MTKSEKTSASVAHKASEILHSKTSTPEEKSVAASALAQSRTNKKTSAEVASKAAKMLDAKESSAADKSVAASVLTQKVKE